jgi:hypothetical protein
VTSGVLARDLSHPAVQDMAWMDEYSGQAQYANISSCASIYMASHPKRPLSRTRMMHDSVLCFLQEELSQKRVALSVLLMYLLSQQAERRRQLLNTLTEMEKRRWVDEEVGEYARNCLLCGMKVP